MKGILGRPGDRRPLVPEAIPGNRAVDAAVYGLAATAQGYADELARVEAQRDALLAAIRSPMYGPCAHCGGACGDPDDQGDDHGTGIIDPGSVGPCPECRGLGHAWVARVLAAAEAATA